jgi:hypothetical protein
MTSSTAIGWVRVRPAGRDHCRQVLDQLAGDLPGQALVADHDPSAQNRYWDAAHAEQPFDLPPAAQVRRQGVVVIAQPAEVDDLL